MEIQEISRAEAGGMCSGSAGLPTARTLRVTPSEGPILVLGRDGATVAELSDPRPRQRRGGLSSFEPKLATCGTDGRVRIYENLCPLRDRRGEIALGKAGSSASRGAPTARASPPRSACGSSSSTKPAESRTSSDAHKSSVCDFACGIRASPRKSRAWPTAARRCGGSVGRSRSRVSTGAARVCSRAGSPTVAGS